MDIALHFYLTAITHLLGVKTWELLVVTHLFIKICVAKLDHLGKYRLIFSVNIKY